MGIDIDFDDNKPQTADMQQTYNDYLIRHGRPKEGGRSITSPESFLAIAKTPRCAIILCSVVAEILRILHIRKLLNTDLPVQSFPFLKHYKVIL